MFSCIILTTYCYKSSQTNQNFFHNSILFVDVFLICFWHNLYALCLLFYAVVGVAPVGEAQTNRSRQMRLTPILTQLRAYQKSILQWRMRSCYSCSLHSPLSFANFSIYSFANSTKPSAGSRRTSGNSTFLQIKSNSYLAASSSTLCPPIDELAVNSMAN